MVGLARKILISAAADGLVLQPLSSKKDHRPPASPIKLKYGDAAISNNHVSREVPSDAITKPNASFESFGIVGLITVPPHSYLVTITRRQQVAVVRGRPVYVVTEVALTPCSSQSEAAEAIARTAAHLKRASDAPAAGGSSATDTSSAGDSDDNDESSAPVPVAASDDVSDAAAEEEPDDSRGRPRSITSIASDVMTKKGGYGRFAQRWFSRGGWMQDQKRSMGLSNGPPAAAGGSDGGDSKKGGVPSPEGPVVAGAGDGVKTTEAAAKSATTGSAAALLPKLLRTTQILFGTSRSFFFSYDHDITRSLSSQPLDAAQSEIPLCRRVDPVFWWNRHVSQRLVEAGADAFVLPLMQGFVGQRTFVVDSDPPQVDEGVKDSLELSDLRSRPQSGTASPQSERTSESLNRRSSEKVFDITVISRRSVKRAGLRYLRRGVDDNGNTANFVETEQILSPAEGGAADKTYSFTQIRGSIPLFFVQSPYSLKPAPVIQHSPESNYQALKKQFSMLKKQYGSLQIVNLVEKHGTEASIGEQYEKCIKRLNEESGPDGAVPFEWFDFHSECRGMKFENVSKLVDILRKQLERFGSTVESSGEIISRQAGVLRTNCMDCLDRTNVCQSSFAKFMLDLQLSQQGFDMSAQRDQETSWFNTLWADNGDSISKQYASTAAMKGDYTRTKKRDVRGALTDIGLSVNRLWSGMINDFFVQTTIDFLLGNVTALVFDEFEVNMMSQDPAVSMQRMREQAIELCQKRVVADEKEEFIGGWTMLTPHTSDSLTAQPFEEAVLLLTDVAMYLCRFDWNLDKVSSFERVELGSVKKVKFGAYVTSTTAPWQLDETKNQGILVLYKPGTKDVIRVNTRSLSASFGKAAAAADDKDKNPNAPGPVGLAGILSRRPAPPTERKIALKALYSQSSLAESSGGNGLTEVQQVVSISAQLERLVALNTPISAGTERESILESGDIISAAEAKRNAGLLEQLGYSIRKLVWA
ncbi:hypothetical protein MAPG_03887 [Magnaporthiopsis poae ATCC 64411]|uniref:Recessive suppressor of secretory defect n=1 Tax=Magnaporthiopsis poae (strain ATCC 64411 / 73-15) TaxID=644358 RepID=A0A0C4DV87_MAGP6|nr:hypothetical protein MAPG_03887 [Magnaporthiopsis poae ATCC 64411]